MKSSFFKRIFSFALTFVVIFSFSAGVFATEAEACGHGYGSSTATVRYVTSGDGRLNGATSVSVKIGNTPSRVPTPVASSGSYFVGWVDECGRSINPSATRIYSNRTFTAVFAKCAYTVKFVASTGGSLRGNTYYQVARGSTVSSTPQAIANSGYSFLGWKDQNGNFVDPTLIPIYNNCTVFTAVFEKTTYCVKFVASNGGSLRGTTQYNVTRGGVVPGVPQVITNTGYIFKGWKDQGGNFVDPTTYIITGNTTFTAVFEKVTTYKVKFNASTGGTLRGTTQYTVVRGETVPAVPQAIANNGYTFTGWLDPSGHIIADPTTYIITGNTTFTAMFEKTSYCVKFVASNGGSLRGTTQYTVLRGGVVPGVPQVITNNGYIFKGWLDPSGHIIDDPTTYIVTGNTTFTAVFEKVTTYKVKFNASTGGTLRGTTQYTVVRGETVPAVPQVVESNGYTFIGWKDPSGHIIADPTAYIVTGNTTFTAMFEKTSYCVKFVASTGGYLRGTTSYMVARDGFVPAVPQIYANNGYAFVGWKDQSGNLVDPLIVPITRDNTIFTAVFQKAYCVKFYSSNGGTISSPTTAQVAYGGYLTDEQVPTPTPNDGFEFVGWKDRCGNIVDPTTVRITNNCHTFTAIFKKVEPPKPVTATVKFVSAAGGNVSGTAWYQVIIGESVPAVPNAVPHAGNWFIGWTDPDGNYVDPATYVINEDITFTAQFETPLTVNFTSGANGNISGPASVQVRAGSTISTMPTPAPHTGYEFVGWVDANNNFVDPMTIVITTDNTTFTALFEQSIFEHTVTYVMPSPDPAYIDDPDKGTYYATEIVLTGNSPMNIPNVNDYSFTSSSDTYVELIGWKDANGNFVDLNTVVITQDTTFTAVLEMRP